ncbi:MAG: hypothetical protein QXY49_04915 [Thermofilaceae archaeon]
MRLTELLDFLAYPAGMLVRRGFEREGWGDPDTLVVESPRRFMERLAGLYDNDLDYARLFIILVACILTERGFRVPPDELLNAFERDDKNFINFWLEELKIIFKKEGENNGSG